MLLLGFSLWGFLGSISLLFPSLPAAIVCTRLFNADSETLRKSRELIGTDSPTVARIACVIVGITTWVVVAIAGLGLIASLFV
jgi:hypothetical protein